MRPIRTLFVAGAALAALAPSASAKAPKDVTVMTRNLYLGADIFRPVDATKGKSGIDALVAFGNANYITRQIVDQTNFPARAKLLAAEIKSGKPDLIGFQEMSTWRSGPFDLAKIGTPTATKVDYDFLKSLTSELKKAGTPYSVVRTEQEADVEGPVFQGSDYSKATAARLSIRDVILRRKGSKVKILKTGSQNYTSRYEVALSGVKFTFLRGAVWADAKLGKQKFRFVTTHLESADNSVAQQQAAELINGPDNVKGKPVISVCDCNSDPNETDTSHGGAQLAYQTLTGKAPYAVPAGTRPLFDAWPIAHPKDPGLTSGFNETVNDKDTSGFGHRIDLVLSRNTKGTGSLKVRSIKRTGIARKTPGGLWASDHAGVIAKLRF